MAPFRIARPRFLAYFLVEGGLIAMLLFGLAQLTLRVTQDTPRASQPATILAISLLFSILLLITQSSNLGEESGLRRELLLFTIISLVTGSMTYVALCAVRGDWTRADCLVALEGAVAVPIAVALWRWLSLRFEVLNVTRERVLIVGTGETARQVCRWIVSSHTSEYAIVGFVDEDDSRVGSVMAMGARIQTDYENLARFAQRRSDLIIVALDEKRGKLPVRQLMELRLQGIEIEEATTFFERVSGKISVETMLPSWLIYSEGFKTSAIRSMLKRTGDLLLASLLLIATAPLMALTAALVLLDSGFPILFRQSRVGRDGREFDVLKFRSMRRDAEQGVGPTWAAKHDPRVTRIGRLIRKLRIDELPQLFNVFKGEMSFVGPRPERDHFVQQLIKKIPYFGLRTTVRPGITGWAQVEYHYGATDEDAVEKLKYDLYYIKNYNLLLDFWIVLKTIKVVVLGAGAR